MTTILSRPQCVDRRVCVSFLNSRTIFAEVYENLRSNVKVMVKVKIDVHIWGLALKDH